MASSEDLAPGVRVSALRGEGVVARVATIAPGAPVALRVVVAGGRIGGPLERTSSMCLRVDCIVAVNGDFYVPSTRLPVGGVVREGALLKSPSATHHQLLVGRDGRLAAGPVRLSGKLVASDLREIAVDGVNGERRRGDLIAYTPAFGDSTRTNRFGAELVVRVVVPEHGLELGETALVELVELVDGGGATPIPRRGVVLSGHGEAAGELRALWRDVGKGVVGRRALLRLRAHPDAFHSLGGTPILLRGGRPWFDPTRTSFVRGRHPRTAVGWDAEGRVFLVTVDGRQPGRSVGMSIPELARFLAALGATDALNLDGGGSTTFVERGRVANVPSDRLVTGTRGRRIVRVPEAGDRVVAHVERPVANALAVVPAGAVDPLPDDPLAGDRLDLPRVVDLPPPTAGDPASVPGADLPALVASAPVRAPDSLLLAAAVLALLVVGVALGVVRSTLRAPASLPRRRRRRLW